MPHFDFHCVFAILKRNSLFSLFASQFPIYFKYFCIAFDLIEKKAPIFFRCTISSISLCVAINDCGRLEPMQYLYEHTRI